MINNKKVVVVMPAYNAEKTLRDTYNEIPFDIVDEVVVVDDASTDNTVAVAKSLGIQQIVTHQKNKGYGGNQKSCYKKALDLGADIIIMVHPDYQYTPKLIPSMAHLIASGLFQTVLASRILGKGAIQGGMPRYKYVANRLLTLVQNLLIGQKLSEYHTGYRAFTRDVIEHINYQANSNDFVFDNEMITQIFAAGYTIGEITCPTRYFSDASSINLNRSVKYGLGVLATSFKYRFQKIGLKCYKIFEKINNDE
ncbi:MAG: glycosyltransferase family 2 protein [Bacteroidales bacterium]|nr:glycosyltransferase family 2 protein [Bacteroidales bacterium]